MIEIEQNEKKTEIVSLNRTDKNNKISTEEIEKIEETINKSKTKRLIVDDGIGSRIKDKTEQNQKSMIDIGGKTLLKRQQENYKENCIDDK